MKKPEKTASKGAPKDPRKERLAQQLRANLQRRKQQARDREDEPDMSGETDVGLNDDKTGDGDA